MTALLALLTGCFSNSPPEPPADAPDAPPPADAPPQAELPLEAALLAAGACAGTELLEGRPAAIATYEEGALAIVACERFAYQEAFEVWRRDASGAWGPVQSGVGVALKGLGGPELDATTGELWWLEKSRGPGDCGAYYRYRLEGAVALLTEHRARECEDEGEIPPVRQWPIVGPSGTGRLESLQNGDAACYVAIVEDSGAMQSWHGSFDLCAPEVEALIGQRVVVELGEGRVMAPSCEGDPDCPDSITVPLATAVRAAP